MNYYTYTVYFVDGYYYHGYHKNEGIDPLTDGYFGSPDTHRGKWLTTMHWKEVTGIYNTLEEATFAEQESIRPVFRDDPFCLNEACNGNFSKESCILGGRISGSRAVKTGQLSSIRSPESCKAGGVKGSKTLMKEGKGLFGMSPREKNAAVSNGAKAQHQQRWKNTHPGFDPYISTPCGLSNWQKARGIDTSYRVQVLG